MDLSSYKDLLRNLTMSADGSIQKYISDIYQSVRNMCGWILDPTNTLILTKKKWADLLILTKKYGPIC